jgi:hypothetical protein
MSKQKNLPMDMIRKNLAKVGWTGEQINYAIKKYEGKRTGLWFPGSDKNKK